MTEETYRPPQPSDTYKGGCGAAGMAFIALASIEAIFAIGYLLVHFVK